MPQGRRKIPFSGKQKKQQLQQKRDRKKDECERADQRESKSESRVVDEEPGSSGTQIQNQIFTQSLDSIGRGKGQTSADRYRLKFIQESRDEIEKRKMDGYRVIIPVAEEETEIDINDVFLPGSVLDIPKRPTWSYDLSKEQLEMREHKYFTEYLMNIEKAFNLKDLSYFETNLETWRQLWRVLEIADVVLIIVDIRFPSLLYSPVLYEYITKELNKDVILVLNKIDLAPPSVVVAWKYYFKQHFPKLHIVCFTSFPGGDVTAKNSKPGLQKKRKRCKIRMAAQATKRLMDICQEIVKNNVDLSSWERKIEEEIQDAGKEEDYEDAAEEEVGEMDVSAENRGTMEISYERFKNGILSIGCIGFPNVGKSSLMNAIMGKKVVSVSRTPGHTKHFQTIFLTPTVKLCDCPGLVFPSKVPKSLQVLNGSYPIAQVREPYSAIRFIAERISLQKLLQIQHPDSSNSQWTPFDICDAWAEKRGFYTSKGARRDASRAGNNLLRMTLEGRIRLCLRPPGFTQSKEKWQQHSDIEEIRQILETDQETLHEFEEFEELSASEEEAEKQEADIDHQPTPYIKNKFSALEVD